MSTLSQFISNISLTPPPPPTETTPHWPQRSPIPAPAAARSAVALPANCDRVGCRPRRAAVYHQTYSHLTMILQLGQVPVDSAWYGIILPPAHLDRYWTLKGIGIVLYEYIIFNNYIFVITVSDWTGLWANSLPLQTLNRIRCTSFR